MEPELKNLLEDSAYVKMEACTYQGMASDNKEDSCRDTASQNSKNRDSHRDTVNLEAFPWDTYCWKGYFLTLPEVCS